MSAVPLAPTEAQAGGAALPCSNMVQRTARLYGSGTEGATNTAWNRPAPPFYNDFHSMMLCAFSCVPLSSPSLPPLSFPFYTSSLLSPSQGACPPGLRPHGDVSRRHHSAPLRRQHREGRRAHAVFTDPGKAVAHISPCRHFTAQHTTAVSKCTGQLCRRSCRLSSLGGLMEKC